MNASVESPSMRELMDALRRPEAYPHRPERVDFLQTHISMLYFADDLVYKVKKPVDMGFLNYTTIENRQHYCDEEVRLNRRLAPETYLGVVPIVRDASGRIRIDPEDADRHAAAGEVIDHAVKMTRLPGDRMLIELLERGEIDNEQLSDVVDLLVDFHQRCPTGPGVDPYGAPEEIQGQIREAFTRIERLCRGEDAWLAAHLRAWCDRFLTDHRRLFEKRIEEARIREGHGDLHAGNICLLPEKIVIYDCIEFTKRFRCRDVACELAFLAMDLDARGYRGFAAWLTHRYAERANDPDFPRVLPFYKTYLAGVRCMVALMKTEEDEVHAGEAEKARAQARRYLHLAATYPIGPAVMLMCGPPGTGKSTVARALAEPFEALHLRSDAIRKQLAGIEPTERVRDARAETLYSEAMTDRTYSTMLERARESLEHRRPVIADATFASPRSRAGYPDLVRAIGAPLVIVHLHSDDEIIRERLAAREGDAREVSDADWSVYTRLRDHFRPPTEFDAAQRIEAPPNAPVSSIVSRALDRLLDQRDRAGDGEV